MEIFKYIAYKWKKKFGIMSNQQNEAMLQRYKEQYFGKTYQWVRPINNEAVGEIVRVVDVKQRGDMMLLVFNSGTPVNISLVGTHLQPYGNEESQLIPPGGLTGQGSMSSGGPIPIPEELQAFTTEKQQKISFSSPQPPVPAVQAAPAPKAKSEMFAQFQSEEKTINLSVKIKMPDIMLVRMMYSNAADKDKFLGEFAEYIISEINADTAKEAVRAMLGGAAEQAVEVDGQSQKNTVTDDKQGPAADGKE